MTDRLGVLPDATPATSIPELIAALRAELSAALPGDLVVATDRFDRLCRTALEVAGRRTDDAPLLTALAGACRQRQREVAVAAHAGGELIAAERAFLRYVGLAPPNRASGDIERPLAPDPRYKVLARELLQARIRALTGNTPTAPSSCCAATNVLASADRAGFASIVAPTNRIDGDQAWLLSPLDPSLGFVPCSYGCIAAQQSRRETLARRDLRALRNVLAARLLRLAPGFDLLLAGERGRGAGTLRLTTLCAVVPTATPPALLRLLEALVIRRLLTGREIRFDGDAIDARQGLVFVKMLHRETARYLDLTVDAAS